MGMGLRDKIKEAIEEFDWINDIDSKVEEETIDVLYNKPQSPVNRMINLS